LTKTAGNIFVQFPEFSPLKDKFGVAILPGRARHDLNILPRFATKV